MKAQSPVREPDTTHDRLGAEDSGPRAPAAQQRLPCGLLGALLLSLPVLQAEANFPGGEAATVQQTPPIPILDRVESVRERLGVTGDGDAWRKAVRDEALLLSSGPDWSDWYNR